MNLCVSLLSVAFCLSLFSEMGLPERKRFKQFVAVILVLGLFSAPLVLSNVTLDRETITGLLFLRENSSTNSNILADPVYGHAVAFVSQRKVLSDLMVEYASEFKLRDSYRFLLESDYSVLSKYSISYVINTPDKINRNAWQLYEIEGRSRIEFEQLDKVFSNKSLFIHSSRK